MDFLDGCILVIIFRCTRVCYRMDGASMKTMTGKTGSSLKKERKKKPIQFNKVDMTVPERPKKRDNNKLYFWQGVHS